MRAASSAEGVGVFELVVTTTRFESITCNEFTENSYGSSGSIGFGRRRDDEVYSNYGFVIEIRPCEIER